MRAILLLPLLLLTACGDDVPDADELAKEEADVGFIQGLQANDPPPKPIELQAIRYPDIEAYQLYGANCAFAPGESLGAIVMAVGDSAWMKVDDKMVRLAADTGGAKLPMGAWRHYNGKEYSLDLDIGEPSKNRAPTGSVNYPGTLEVRDAYKQLVYGAQGTIQCGA